MNYLPIYEQLLESLKPGESVALAAI